MAGLELLVTLYADAARHDELAQKRLVSPQDRFPVVFDNLDAPRLVLEVKVVKNETQLQPALYYTRMETELAAPGLKLPRLERGTNTIQVTDDPDSSHRARIVLSWLEKPEPDRVWDDFEKDFGWGEGGEQVESTPANGLAFTGERFARIRFPAAGGDRQMVRYTGGGAGVVRAGSVFRHGGPA